MEAQICVENGNVVFPLLNEHPGSRMLAGGAGNSKLRQQFVTWLRLKDGGPLVRFLDFGCHFSPWVPTPGPSVRDTGVVPATGFGSIFLEF